MKMRHATYILLILFLLQPVLNSYNTTIASEASHYSSIAYSSKQSIVDWTCSQCSSRQAENPHYFDDQNLKLQGFVIYSQYLDMFVVAMRGSIKAKQNWIINFSIEKQAYPYCSGCLVHQGFYQSSKIMSENVNVALTKLRLIYGDKPIIYTGHSLGGAIATLACLSQKIHHLESKVYLYTFGQPRIGNKQFAHFIDSEIVENYRIVFKADGVAHLPRKSNNYQHGGTEIWYKKQSSEFVVCRGDQAKKCSNSIFILSISRKDHNLGKYISLFANIQQPSLKMSNSEQQISQQIQQSLKAKYIKGVDGYDLYNLFMDLGPSKSTDLSAD